MRLNIEKFIFICFFLILQGHITMLFLIYLLVFRSILLVTIIPLGKLTSNVKFIGIFPIDINRIQHKHRQNVHYCQ